MILPILLLLLAQADAPASLPSGQEGRRIAILIGNNAYSKKPLSNAVREAAEMQTAFDSLGFETVLYANAGLIELQFAIRDVVDSLTRADTVVVYFQGYAMQIDGDNLLLPIDFKAPNPVEAKKNSYSASLLLDNLKLAHTSLLILDAGGDQPFDIGKETPVGLANMKARKNAFLLFGTAPGKAIAPTGLFGRFLREALRQPSIGLDTLASSVRAKVEESSGKQQVPWHAVGSRTVADTVLHTPGSRPSGPGKAATRELMWDEIWGQSEWLKSLHSIRRSTRNENRGVSLAKLDAEYGPARRDAARAAQKDEFETTPQYLARTSEARAAAAEIEGRYKTERDRLETLFKDPTGDPDLRALESLKAQRFRGPCKAEWMDYDADRQALTLYAGGAEREFDMLIAEARDFKSRSSKLTCEGGFTPESVTVSDPTGRLKLIENPPLKGLPVGTAGVTAPRVLFRVEPEYSEVARALRFQGATVLKMVISVNGVARSIRVARRLGYGLDEKAMAAVRKWRFQPGMKNGEPVAVEATIEVNFRLL